MKHATVLTVLSLVAQVTSNQAPYRVSDISATKKRQPLTGRFIHITDFHPDILYKEGATIESGCHELPKGKDHDEEGSRLASSSNISIAGNTRTAGLAGKWGTGVSDCDSPMSLVNMTIDWLAKEWAHEIDFIVWTGDSARHDLDRNFPRTPNEIFQSNRMMVQQMQQAFPHIPIVPSLGNNDIYPHNVLAPGPNNIISQYTKIWSDIIPNDYEHIFERGGYFSLEVIPDRLAVISLNTLYWYKANTLADGCLDRNKDPGAFELEWLEVQLDQFRGRGMQVWLSGHIPPHLGMYFDNCYLKYGDLALRFQDTIVGHLYGHMNVDHFFFIDVQELEAPMPDAPHISEANLTSPESLVDGPPPRIGPLLEGSGRYRTMGRAANNFLQEELRKDFGEMPGPAKIKLKDYAVVNVAPSVIPTYYPGVRVFSYNISNMEDEDFWSDMKKKRRTGHRHRKKKAKHDCRRPENRDRPHCVFARLPRHYDKASPSRSNGPLSPLGYTQFFLPDVDSTRDIAPDWKIEYSTFHPRKLVPQSSGLTETQPPPVPLHLLPGYDPTIVSLYAANDVPADEGQRSKLVRFEEDMKHITPWKLKDLTIKNWVKLARKVVTRKKSWKKFQEIMYVSSDN
ncbi:Metallo-dependent phosphatase-like protein [Kockovaella imperatae]|uniref:Endopolyphosphatase n=1 Tax=Kockovaella imperatae TaxID=4999 RepID=A0A1Y1UIS4_9TREE|nr:Metallo-dependent phosphatase-like protein [Kockovaella imperatae]ORX37963.1 Metallo-dependent phosphatase-like protein [Kockovaella imperatae]